MVFINRSVAFFNRGFAYAGKSQHDRAIADFSQALKLNPKDAMIYNYRAFSFYFTGDYENAWQDVKKAQSLGYEVNPEFLEELRRVYGRKKFRAHQAVRPQFPAS
jgi:lipoprotein NlpI